MKKFLLIAGWLIVVCAAVLFFVWPKGPDLSKYEGLKDPQINKLEKHKVIAVTLTGEPEKIAGEGIAALYKMYYSLKQTDKTVMAVPKARWTGGTDTPKDKWSAEFALQVPEEVLELPAQKDGLKIELKYWDYGAAGEAAEILHLGSYDDETFDVNRLMEFVKDNKYILAGKHEEEYIKGPGMFFKGDPKNYQTIIRYAVVKGKGGKHGPVKISAKKAAKTAVKKGKK